MNDPLTNKLISSALYDHDALGQVIYPPHMTWEGACLIAARAVDVTVEELRYYEDEVGGLFNIPPTPAIVEAAFKHVLAAAWDARGAKDQRDIEESHEIWQGNARHEARKGLG